MTKRSAYKSVDYSSDVAGAIGDAYSEFQSLRDEMSEWRDSLEDKLSHTQKYEEVSSAADALDGFCDDEPDVPEGLDGAVKTTQQVSARKGRGESRAVRCSNALSLLGAAIAVVEETIEKIDGEADEKTGELSEELEEEKATLEELKDHLENAAQEAEGVEFPGMYG